MKKTYFIQAGESGPIKIGSSKNPHTRITQLQVAHHEELNLLAYSIQLNELDLHRKFKSDHIKGEWFRPSSDLIGFIKGVGMGDQDMRVPVNEITQTHIRYPVLNRSVNVVSSLHPKDHHVLSILGNEASPVFNHGDMWIINTSRTSPPIDGEACVILHNEHRLLRFWSKDLNSFISGDANMKKIKFNETRIIGYPVEKVDL